MKRGLTAGTFQHEVDHLDGILFVDRADPRTLRDLGAVRPPSARRVRAARRRAQRRGGIVSAERATALWCELAWLGGERRRARGF